MRTACSEKIPEKAFMSDMFTVSMNGQSPQWLHTRRRSIAGVHSSDFSVIFNFLKKLGEEKKIMEPAFNLFL